LYPKSLQEDYYEVSLHFGMAFESGFSTLCFIHSCSYKGSSNGNLSATFMVSSVLV
jgi:hypothetical protein